MKFRFRLDTVMRQRRVEQDLAQKDYFTAQAAVNQQLSLIKVMYEESDSAREMAGSLQMMGGTKVPDLIQIEEFISLQKLKIQRAREKARELMAIAEEKQEILVEKAQNVKVLEKLREKQHEEFKKEKSKRETIEMDDMTIMRQKIAR